MSEVKKDPSFAMPITRSRSGQITTRAKEIARHLYEFEGCGIREIMTKTGFAEQTLHHWKRKGGWIKAKYKEAIKLTELQSRIKKAEQIGIGEESQMMKAKELMDAKIPTQVMEPSEDGKKMVAKTKNIPDYKTQNEGLKRAMELTGTKIERKEVEHKGQQEVVHRYELPAKRPM